MDSRYGGLFSRRRRPGYTANQVCHAGGCWRVLQISGPWIPTPLRIRAHCHRPNRKLRLLGTLLDLGQKIRQERKLRQRYEFKHYKGGSGISRVLIGLALLILAGCSQQKNITAQGRLFATSAASICLSRLARLPKQLESELNLPCCGRSTCNSSGGRVRLGYGRTWRQYRHN